MPKLPKLPGARRRAANRPAAELELPSAVSAGAPMRIKHTTTVQPLLQVTDTFTGNLDDWDIVDGDPSVTLGWLSGAGVIRHKQELMSDSCKVTCSIAFVQLGTSRLAVCADKNLQNYYALELVMIAGPLYKLQIVKGDASQRVETSFRDNLTQLLFGVLSFFFPRLIPAKTYTFTLLVITDTVSLWYDEVNSTIRAYENGIERLTLKVPRSEIPHGPGHRYHGVASGVEFGSILFSDYLAEDIGDSTATEFEVTAAIDADMQWDATASAPNVITASLEAEATRVVEPGASPTFTASLDCSAEVS